MATTRSQIRDRARRRVDQDGSTFPTDAQYNDFIDDAAREVWYDLIQAGWPINFTTVTKTATNIAFIPLSVSGTVAFIRGVFYFDGNTYFELKRITEGDRATLLSVPGTDRASHYEYRIDATSGPGIELLPRVGAGTYKVDYITEHPGFTGDSDTWYGPARSDELVALRAAVKGARKENNADVANAVEAEYRFLMSQVQAMASWADMRNAATIRRVRDPLGEQHRDAFDYNVEIR